MNFDPFVFCLTDVLTLINKDEVEGSSASKQEANEVRELTTSLYHLCDVIIINNVVIITYVMQLCFTNSKSVDHLAW